MRFFITRHHALPLIECSNLRNVLEFNIRINKYIDTTRSSMKTGRPEKEGQLVALYSQVPRKSEETGPQSPRMGYRI